MGKPKTAIQRVLKISIGQNHYTRTLSIIVNHITQLINGERGHRGNSNSKLKNIHQKKKKTLSESYQQNSVTFFLIK